MSTILLVDDDVHILRAAEFKLKRSGFDVLTAVDGEEAWQVIERTMPELVVTDVQMPRLDGIELVRRIRATPESAHLPVILLTAKGYELPRQELVAQLGVVDVVSKPFSPRDLCSRARIALDNAGTASAIGGVE